MITKETIQARREALVKERVTHTARVNATEGAIVLLDQLMPHIEATDKAFAELEAERDRLRREICEMRAEEDVSPPVERQMGD